jgi:CRP/FNR family transcriptional regulator, anaerobic regulatory protein
MSELEKYISSYFGVINPKELTLLSNLFSPQKISRNEYLLHTGEQCNFLSFIQTGIVRIYVITEEGKEVTQWISTPGYFITDLSSLVFSTPARWNIQALIDTELYTIDKKAYQEIGNIIPQWHELEKLFIARCFTILEDRIFSHLSMSAEERYNFFFENNKDLFNQVPLQYIASMLGMSAETFSRIRKK